MLLVKTRRFAPLLAERFERPRMALGGGGPARNCPLLGELPHIA
jgi:hypothetical protein